MGKKKGKKGGDQSGDAVNNDAVDLDALAAQIEAVNPAPTKKKKPTKKKQKEDDNWEDEVLHEIAELSVQSEGKQTAVSDEQPSKVAIDKAEPEKLFGNVIKEKDDGDLEFYNPSDDEKDGKRKKNKLQEVSEDTSTLDVDQTVSIKTKAQKQAEKKERERKKKEQQKLERQRQQQNKEKLQESDQTDEVPLKPAPASEEVSQQDKPATSSKKKDKKKKSATDEDKSKSKKKPNKATLQAMQKHLSKLKEDEEKAKREEEETIRKEEEAEQKRLQKLEEERLKKERKKQKEKERIQRLKKEGKYLTPAQKEAQRKREAYVESLRQQGLLPTEKDPNEKPKKVRYDDRRKRKKVQESEEQPGKDEEMAVEEQKAEEIQEEKNEVVEVEAKEEEEEDVVDDWEAISSDDAEDDKSKQSENEKGATVTSETTNKRKPEENDDEEEEEEVSEEESEESSEESYAEDLTPRQRAEKRIQNRKQKNAENQTEDELRSPVICVMGHVDTGKTKILDKIRHSHVQDGEAGGITQQIGATNVPVEVIRQQTKMVKSFSDMEIRFPGLLVIDTPGHESFSNLRSRGSSVCDMAILVVDIMHGLESQTLESITMLKKRKTPFVVALNKVDRLYDWKRGPDSDIVNTIKKQKRHVKEEFDEKLNDIIVQFATQNLNVKLFYENDDPKEWISMVPTSAHSGDGMGNLIALVVELCQTMLSKRLSYSEELQCTVLEVKAIQGLGTTVDIILTNGKLNYSDTIVLAGVEGPIVTHIKGLLMPQPLKELRVKNPYDKYDHLKAAQGVKILAKDLDRALAGTQMLVAHHDDEIELLKEEVQSEVDKTLQSYKLQERGVFVQASTLGSLEALLAFLKQSKIPYAGISIGPVHKKDIMKASVMLEHDTQWAVILAFDVKIEREAQDLADNLGVKIFSADIIYHLFDAFMQHREDLKKQKQNEFRNVAVFPCKVRILPNCVFKSRDPIVVGVVVEAGQLRQNTPLCIPSREFLVVGYVTSMEFNHKVVEIARTGQEVCIKIEGSPGEPPKMVGRHFEETDILVSKISRDSINALKDWFREEMQKSDWQLTIELKKRFEIL